MRAYGSALARVLTVWWALLAVALLFAQPARAVTPVPALSAQVMDTTGTLSDVQLAALRDKLAQFERQYGTQVVVLMVSSTAGEDIAAYANRVASEWKIGRKDIGDGLLVVVAKDDRRVRIEVARALEASVTDLGSHQIIDRYIVPRFRSGDFAGGLDAGLDALFAEVRHEQLPVPGQASGQREPLSWGHMAMVFGVGIGLFYVVIAQKLGRRKGFAGALLMAVPSILAYFLGWNATGTLDAALSYFVVSWFVTSFVAAVVTNMIFGLDPAHKKAMQGVLDTSLSSIDSGSGSNWGSSSSGGYSSGGGGSFGGGGSSGSW